MFQRVLGVFLLVKVCFRDGWNIMCILAFIWIQIFFKKNYKCKLIFKKNISILAWWRVIKFFLENSLLTKCNWSAILNGHVFLFGTSAVEYLLAIFLKPTIFSLFLYHNSFSPFWNDTGFLFHPCLLLCFQTSAYFSWATLNLWEVGLHCYWLPSWASSVGKMCSGWPCMCCLF